MTQKTYSYRTGHLAKREKGHLHIIEPTRGSQLTGKWGIWARFRSGRKSPGRMTTGWDTLETRVICLQSEAKISIPSCLEVENHNVYRVTTTGIIYCPDGKCQKHRQRKHKHSPQVPHTSPTFIMHLCRVILNISYFLTYYLKSISQLPKDKCLCKHSCQ